MAENFIPANELPVAEGDEVSVLCLENGEMKQKPASGLGGGSSYDAVITITDIPEEERTEYELTSGSYDVLREKLLNDEVVNIKVVRKSGAWRYISDTRYAEVCEDTAEDDAVWVVVRYGSDTYYFGIKPDNTVFMD